VVSQCKKTGVWLRALGNGDQHCLWAVRLRKDFTLRFTLTTAATESTFCNSLSNFSHTTTLANFYKTQAKKCRTSNENIAFYRTNTYVSVLNLYTSAMPGI